MEGLEPEPGRIHGFSYAQWPSLPYQQWDWVHVAIAEALRFQPKLVPLPLSVCSPPSNGTSALVQISARAIGMKQMPSASQGTHWDGPGTPVRSSGSSLSATSVCTLIMVVFTVFKCRSRSKLTAFHPCAHSPWQRQLSS